MLSRIATPVARLAARSIPVLSATPLHLPIATTMTSQTFATSAKTTTTATAVAEEKKTKTLKELNIEQGFHPDYKEYDTNPLLNLGETYTEMWARNEADILKTMEWNSKNAPYKNAHMQETADSALKFLREKPKPTKEINEFVEFMMRNAGWKYGTITDGDEVLESMWDFHPTNRNMRLKEMRFCLSNQDGTHENLRHFLANWYPLMKKGSPDLNFLVREGKVLTPPPPTIPTPTSTNVSDQQAYIIMRFNSVGFKNTNIEEVCYINESMDDNQIVKVLQGCIEKGEAHPVGPNVPGYVRPPLRKLDPNDEGDAKMIENEKPIEGWHRPNAVYKERTA